jgi:hypothetical protein
MISWAAPMSTLVNSQSVRTVFLAASLAACLGPIVNAQTPAPPREHRVRDAVIGAFLGGAAGAAIGFAVGSLGGEEPSCVASPCEGHSYAKQGARVGLVVGIPVGAIIGWRGTFLRGSTNARDVSRSSVRRPETKARAPSTPRPASRASAYP